MLAGALSPYVRDIFLLLIFFWEPPFPSLCLHDLFVSALFPDSRNEHNIQVKPVRDSCRTFAGAPGKLSFVLPWFLPWWAARLELLVEEEDLPENEINIEGRKGERRRDAQS